MTQRIFDVENEKDMQDLWNILPDDIVRISPMINKEISYLEYKDDEDKTDLFKIEWHDKTEITRPMQEATEQDIGKLCMFWDNANRFYFGVLSRCEREKHYYAINVDCGSIFKHCRRLTKQEIEELC